MRIKYKEKHIELERVPPSFTLICELVQTYFKVSHPVLLIRDNGSLSEISSSQQFNKMNYKNIQEIEVKSSINTILSSPHTVNLDKMDSIDTCTSHDRSDSDESKQSDLIRSEEIDSDRFVSECIGNSISTEESTMQTDEITCISSFSGRDQAKLSDFSSQFDSALIFEIKELEEVVKKEFNQLKKKIKHETDAVHKNTKCYQCAMSPIVGPRYECAICKYELCENCEENIGHPHEMFKFKQANAHIVEKEKIVKRLVALGFGKFKDVQEIAFKMSYDFEKIIEFFLFSR